MKFTLLVVGRTVEKHYITAINDYVERTKHYVSFDMEVIPELKNTKSLSMEQQKEKEGEDPESLAARRCSSIARRAWKRIPLHRVCQLDRAENAYRKQAAGVHHRRTLRILSFRLSGCPGKDFTSKMTFSHQMIRLIFVEQLYRAMTILNNGPYHHE